MTSLTYGSLFTGVEGFDLGFNNAGMKCLWQVEIDQWCQAVLKYNSPNTEKFTDVKKVGKENLRPVDLICGGFPCQDLSVAGKRKGMAGKRSGLWYEFARIIAELKPSWVAIENVPGLLSSNGGEDFAIILRWLGECGYYASWRILDSQYWGVAQRRRRLFIVGSLGNTDCTEILFESEGMPWNPQKGREKGEGFTHPTAGCLGASGRGVERAGESRGQDPVVAVTETGAGFWSEGKPRLRCSTAPSQPQTIVAFSCKDDGRDVSEMSPTLRSMHHDKSHMGGGGQIAVAYNIQQNDGGNHKRKDRPHGGMYVKETETSLTLGSSDKTAIVKQVQWASGGGKVLNDTAQSLRSGAEHNYQFAMQNMAVRRLTPRECERLQGFPNDWTWYGINEKGEKIEISDSQRYKMLGNAVTRNVSEWIGRRIVNLYNKQLIT